MGAEGVIANAIANCSLECNRLRRQFGCFECAVGVVRQRPCWTATASTRTTLDKKIQKADGDQHRSSGQTPEAEESGRLVTFDKDLRAELKVSPAKRFVPRYFILNPELPKFRIEMNSLKRWQKCSCTYLKTKPNIVPRQLPDFCDSGLPQAEATVYDPCYQFSKTHSEEISCWIAYWCRIETVFRSYQYSPTLRHGQDS